MPLLYISLNQYKKKPYQGIIKLFIHFDICICIYVHDKSEIYLLFYILNVLCIFILS